MGWGLEWVGTVCVCVGRSSKGGVWVVGWVGGEVCERVLVGVRLGWGRGGWF